MVNDLVKPIFVTPDVTNEDVTNEQMLLMNVTNDNANLLM